MLVLIHPGFTSGAPLLKAQNADFALQTPLWGEQRSNLSELNMIGDVVPYVYNVPEFEIDCSSSIAGGRAGGRAGGGNKVVSSPVSYRSEV